MNIVSWNCRGLGNSSKVEVVKDLIRMASPNILFLQETKIKEGNLLSLSKKTWKKHAGKAVSARGSSGGLATLGTEDIFSLKNSFETQNWIFTELKHISSKISLVIFHLYVPVNSQEKRECWSSWENFLAANNLSNILVAGDLKITLDPEEKLGGVCGRDPMHRVVEHLISTWDLMDLKPKRGQFT